MSRRLLIIFITLISAATVFFISQQESVAEKEDPNSWFRIPIQNPWVDTNAISVSIAQAVKAKPVYIAQDDPKLIEYIQKSGLIRNPSNEPYNLTHPEIIDTSKGQSEVILKALKNMTNGFFVECGALDGETRSNTLFMERNLGWTGLLIEGDPKNFQQVIGKRRHAFTINACLAIHPYPHQVSFKQNFNVGRISANREGNKTRNGFTDVQCFPLFSLMAAMKVTTIDYFSLDIEGDELKVLRNLPFDKLLIKTLSVEYIHGEGEGPLEDFMVKKNYRKLARVTQLDGTANDLLFIHRSLDV